MSANKGIKHHQTRLKESDILDIRNSFSTMSNNDCAIKYDVHYSTISLIRSGKTWKHI